MVHWTAQLVLPDGHLEVAAPWFQTSVKVDPTSGKTMAETMRTRKGRSRHLALRLAALLGAQWVEGWGIIWCLSLEENGKRIHPETSPLLFET